MIFKIERGTINPTTKTMKRLFKSFTWAMNGVRTTWREEVNFRIEIIVAIIVIALAFYLNFSVLELMIVISCIGAVLGAEMLNTAVEDLCDLVEPGHNDMVGKVKDIMAGFVLIVSFAALSIGFIIFSYYF